MKKYIFVNQVTGPLFIDILNIFANKQHDVLLYTGKIEKTSSELSPNIKIKLLTKYRRHNPFLRIFTWAIFTLSTSIRLIFKKKDFELFLVSNPPTAPFIGLLMHKIFGIKYHVLIYDIYPDSLVRLNYITEKHIIFRFWSRLNHLTFTHTENIFTISDYMVETISKYEDNRESKIKVINNWVDTDFIKPIKKEDNWFAKKYGLVDKITILYSGNLGTMHDLESLIEAAAKLKDNNKIVFLIIGDGAKKNLLKEMVKNYELKNVLFLPFQKSGDLPYSMTSADIGVITLAEGTQDLAVPSKTYYMMAAANALLVIANKYSEIAKLCYKYNIGEVVEPNSPDKIVDFIKRCVSDKNLLKLYSENSRKASFNFTPKNAEEYYNYVQKIDSAFS